MKLICIVSFVLFVTQTKAWSKHDGKSPLELFLPSTDVHTLTDCMHVTSEEGDFVFRKVPRFLGRVMGDRRHLIEAESEETPVCGAYFVTDPDKVVEVTVKYLDIDCEMGGLVGFVDGWELNGQYFPGIHDHELPLEQRVSEFCNNPLFPKKSYRKRKFISNQNAALFQYRIPVQGSFIISVRYLHNPKPCHIMAEGLAPYYILQNHGMKNNCTLSALFPAVVSIFDIDVGANKENVLYDGCDELNIHDKIDIGGSSGLDSYVLEKGSTVCGKTTVKGPEQAIFCGITTVRLDSSGDYKNKVLVSIRMAEEDDINIATVACAM